MKTQFEKLGGTPYVPGKIAVKLPRGFHIRIKELNRIRRKAVELINEERLKNYQISFKKKKDFYKLISEKRKNTNHSKRLPALR